MKNIKQLLPLLLLVFVFLGCPPEQNDSDGTPVTSWRGLSVPAATTAIEYANWNGKTNVLKVSPTGNEYGWAVLTRNLGSYTRDVTITISGQVWINTPAKAVWQVNTSGYPEIAGSFNTNIATGQWVTVNGSRKLSLPTGGTLYLSSQQLGNITAYLADFTVTIVEDTGVVTGPTDGGVIREGVVFLTIGDRRDLNDLLPAEFTGKTVTWASSNASLVDIGTTNGIAEAKGINTNGASTFVSGFGTGTTTITASAEGIPNHTITVTATTEALINISNLPSLKDHFAQHFLIGNIYRGTGTPVEISGTGSSATIGDARLTRHFNAITAENNMKPSYLITGRNTTTGVFTWNTGNQTIADNFVYAANNAGMKVIGHTLLWHSQNPQWVWDQVATKGNNNNPAGFGTNPGPGVARITKEQALTIMRQYINAIAGRYKGQIHTWDVLNEIFPDGITGENMVTINWKDAMRNGRSGEGQDRNPWYIAIGSDFVYEGFLAARHADPNAILYYNDYNTDNPNRARLIHDMVVEINNYYLAQSASVKPSGEPADRLLIEGIGMQEHHNLGIADTRIKATIDLFRAMSFAGSSRKIRLSVSELDLIAVAQYSHLGDTGPNRHTESPVTNTQLTTQADLFRAYMRLYIANSDIIERVSLWGITDNVSWRSRGLPLLFDHAGRAKPAYYGFVGALN